MSQALYWKPDGKGERIGGSILRDAIYDEFGCRVSIGCDALAFLRGLDAGGIDGARALIEAIEQHNCVFVWQE